MNFVEKIQANLKRTQIIHTRRAADRVLEGSYKSVLKGRSMNFDELREYVPGDDIKDIDWKATARSQKVLVRQYIADKRHNIMLVFDTNMRMLGASSGCEEKRELAIMTAGTLAFFANKSGDYVAATFMAEKGVKYMPFKTGLGNIELILESYYREVNENNDSSINETLEYVVRNFKRKMIILVVTDIHGINNIPDSTLKKLLISHDVLFVNMSDSLPDKKHFFDMSDRNYAPVFFSKNKRIVKKAQEKNMALIDEATNRLMKYGIPCSTIDFSAEIDKEILNLLKKNNIEKR